MLFKAWLDTENRVKESGFYILHLMQLSQLFLSLIYIKN